MAKKIKHYFLSPAIAVLRANGNKAKIPEFKKKVCDILGWRVGSWYKIQSKGVPNIDLPCWEEINKVMQEYGISPESGWYVKEPDVQE